jgi:predicted dithiol-disulfide oxidoreductase (DUF899 family)
MFDPDWEEGCPACSFVADNFAGSLLHLAARDTAFAVISRAPLEKIERFKKRMGWSFPWLSSFGTDFNYDFRVTLDEKHTVYNRGGQPRRVRAAEERARGMAGVVPRGRTNGAPGRVRGRR